MDFKDYYSLLGVAKTAAQKDIKAAYRKLARKHHPDVNQGDASAEARFKEINEAYEVLGDPDKRKKYDELGANWRAYEQAGAQGPQGAGGFDPRQGGFRTMSQDEMHEMFGNDHPFSDFFETFFGGRQAGEPQGRTRGGRGGRGTRATRPGRDVEQDLDLSLEDAFNGAMRRFSIQHDGEARNVDVRIPAGVSDGSRVRVLAEGERGSGGAKAGDLYLRIRLAPHAQFERKGRDLYARVPMPLTTAVLGGEADVPTLSGKPVRLKVPPTTQNAQIFRLKGHGMPVAGKPEEHGDLYATVDIQLPRQLTPEQRSHFEALQELEKKTES